MKPRKVPCTEARSGCLLRSHPRKGTITPAEEDQGFHWLKDHPGTSGPPRHRCTVQDSGTPGVASPETHSWRLPGARKLVNEMRTDTNLARDRGAEPGLANSPSQRIRPQDGIKGAHHPPTPANAVPTDPSKKRVEDQDFFFLLN